MALPDVSRRGFKVLVVIHEVISEESLLFIASLKVLKTGYKSS